MKSHDDGGTSSGSASFKVIASASPSTTGARGESFVCIDREAPTPRGEPLPFREPPSLRLIDLAFMSGGLDETSRRTLYGWKGGVGPGGRDWRISVNRCRIDSNVGLQQEMRGWERQMYTKRQSGARLSQPSSSLWTIMLASACIKPPATLAGGESKAVHLP